MKGPEDVRRRIGHIRTAISEVTVLDHHLAPEPASRVWRDEWAIERGFEIISEASRHIPPEWKATEPGIAWRKVAGLGNVLRHDDDSVSLDALMELADIDMPDLDAALARILDRLPPL